MNNIGSKNYISLFLLLIVSLFIVPVELFHDLYGHEDTVCLSHTGKTIENKHHHCDILKYHAPSFIENSIITYSDKPFDFTLKSPTEYSYIFSKVFSTFLLRGPPTVDVSALF